MSPPPDPAATVVTEIPDDEAPLLVHPGWRTAFPWLIQGTTVRRVGSEPFDLGVFVAGSDPSRIGERWRRLRSVTGARVLVHARQVHGSEVRLHGARVGVASVGDPDAAGQLGGDDARTADEDRVPQLVPECDGHATAEPGVLLSVAIADCVPVFVVDPDRRAVALLHAGWRGAAAGIVEEGVRTMVDGFGSRPQVLNAHLGPSICGDCYEVGPEVFAAVGRPPPSAPTPLDLRGVLEERLAAAGIPGGSVTRSGHCTRCTGSPLFSHRGGDPHRQVAVLGVSP